MLELLESLLRLATPLLFAALGGLLCERSGIATLCLEGVMLAGAWAAAVVAYFSGPWFGLGAGLITGGLIMSLHALLVIRARVDSIISGLVINLLVAGLTPLLNKWLFHTPTNSYPLSLSNRMPGTWLIVVALCLPFLIHLFLYRTKPGLRILAAGEGEEALVSAGGSPARVRAWTLAGAGMIVALGGVFLSIAHASQFTRDMTSGRGYIALAAVIFGKWRPLPTLLACLFFAAADTAAILLQGTQIQGVAVPVPLIQVFPYLMTLLVLVFFAGSSRPPRSLK